MIANLILGSYQSFSLEDRIINAVLFCATLLSTVLFIGDILQGLELVIYSNAIVMTLVFGAMYFYGRKRAKHKKLVLPFILFGFGPITFMWYFLDGIKGPVFLFIIAFSFIIPIIAKGNLRIWALSAYFLLATALLVFELNYPESIQGYANPKKEIIDIYVATIVLSVNVVIVILLVLHSFNQEKRKVEQLSRTKDKFFTIIAHDLKAPLSALSLLGDIVLDEHDKIDEVNRKRILQSIHENSKKSFNLIENLLQWALSETGLLIAKPKEIVLKKLVENSVNLHKENIKLKNLEVDILVDNDHKVFSDKHMTNTILRNMISNAIKFTPEKGKIEISSSIYQENNMTKICVKDNGIGIEQNVVEKLFDLDSDHTTKGSNNEDGTGLGLKLCKEFVSKNKGNIEITSEENKGTTFTVTLPTSPVSH